MKVIIVGGVAAGAGTAARLRRLNESIEIVMIEEGPYISWANCGLPYHLSGVIPERGDLMITNPERLNAWFNIDVRVNTRVAELDAKAKTVTIRDADGNETREGYDKLVLATGASAVASGLPGDEDPRIFHLRTIPDMDSIMSRIDSGARRAVVVGAGFIGLEAAENLRERGLEVTVIEFCDQVLPTLDKEMSVPLSESLTSMGIAQHLGRKVASFESADAELTVVLDDGSRLAADLVVMSIGVKPNNELAVMAGLELGPRGHILVNESLRTSDNDIYAAGDVVEVVDPIAKVKTAIPLAGPASRQARVVADNIAGRDTKYGGTYGASILKLGNLTAASVGLTERRLQMLELPYEKVYVHPFSNARYYPGGDIMHIKLLFDSAGKIYGAQVVGNRGVDKRVDTISVAIYSGLTVHDLGELELAYAPPFNSARDPVNIAGMAASNLLDGDSRVVHGDKIPADAMVLDVREVAELGIGEIPGSVNIPLSALRQRVGEIDKSRKIVLTCATGHRAYIAERALRLQGFDVYNLSGGFVSWKQLQPHVFSALALPACEPGTVPVAPPEVSTVVDVRTLACPGPVVRIKQEMDKLGRGETMKIMANQSFETDLNSWLKSSGNTLVTMDKSRDHLEAILQKGVPAGIVSAVSGAAAFEEPAAAGAQPAAPTGGHSVAMVMFSNDLDRALAGLILACGLAAGGARVGIFFTLWGLSVLRRDPAPPVRKNLISRMFGMMLPRGVGKLKLSKMHMMGMGTAMMKGVMAQKNVPTLPDLIEQARELGVKFIACDMAMDVMGVTREELIEVDEVAGVASFAALARDSNNTLFI